MGVRWIQPGEKGVDCSFTKPPPSRLVELNYSFVVGYYSTAPSNPKKNLTNPHDYLDVGVDVIYVFEKGATRATEGGAAGYADALAFAKFLDSIGCPHMQAPQIMADDTGTLGTNRAAKLDYMEAARNVIPNRGIYSGSKLGAYCEWALGWLPNAWSWSEGVNTPTALSRADARQEAINLGYHVIQSTGFYIDGLYPVDPNEVVRAFPAWSNHDTQPPGGDDMADTYFSVEGLPGEYLLRGSCDPVPFASAEDRDALVAGMQLKHSTGPNGEPISKEMYDRLFAPAAPPGPAGPAGATGPAGAPGADFSGDVTGVFQGRVV